jgi:hypothetical protein
MNQVFSDNIIKQDKLIRYTKLGMNYMYLHVIFSSKARMYEIGATHDCNMKVLYILTHI